MIFAATLANLGHFAGAFVVTHNGSGYIRALTPTHVIVEGTTTGKFFGAKSFVTV